jgi:hypothetical protein
MLGSVFGGQTDDGGFKNDLCFFDLQKRELGCRTFVRAMPDSAAAQ